jgi:transposase
VRARGLRCTKVVGQVLLIERTLERAHRVTEGDLFMGEKRRRFSAQFKAEAVQMVLGSGRPISDVARDLGIERQTLNKWVNDYQRANLGRGEPFRRAGVSGEDRPRGSREEDLEAGVARLRMENEFLKKAAAFFAKTSQ